MGFDTKLHVAAPEGTKRKVTNAVASMSPPEAPGIAKKNIPKSRISETTKVKADTFRNTEIPPNCEMDIMQSNVQERVSEAAKALDVVLNKTTEKNTCNKKNALR